MDFDWGIHGTSLMNWFFLFFCFFLVFLSFNLNRRNSDTVTSYTSHTVTLGCSLEFPRTHQVPSHSQKQSGSGLSAEYHSQLEWLQPCCLGTQPTVSCQVPKPTCVGCQLKCPQYAPHTAYLQYPHLVPPSKMNPFGTAP